LGEKAIDIDQGLHIVAASMNGGERMPKDHLSDDTAGSHRMRRQEVQLMMKKKKQKKNSKTKKKIGKIIKRVVIILFTSATSLRMANILLFENWVGATFLRCG
jgi:hypothetical protein